MTTLNDFIDRVENAVNDASNTHFSTTVIEEWIDDAIREYSMHFPRRQEKDISTTADDRQYSLPVDLQDILSVEYPKGEDPPEYLHRRPRTHPDFWIEDGYYDWQRHSDHEDFPQLYISTKPDDSETIHVWYLGDHDTALAGIADLTVPDHHLQILVNYCVWKALKHLEQAEEQDPTSNSSLLMAQLAQNSFRAERAYYNSLRRAMAGNEGRSATTRWKMDKHDRIY